MSAKRTQMLTPLMLLALAYHLFALAKDARSVVANIKRFDAQPSLGNLARLLLAEGVFIEEFGLPA